MYPRVTVLTLSDDSFFVCVPLIDKEMRDFKRELSSVFREKGENVQGNRKDGISFFTVLTAFSEEEVKDLSDQIIKNVLKGRNKQG